jgi:uncharacterized protein involved in outer membrane biogenesis
MVGLGVAILVASVVVFGAAVVVGLQTGALGGAVQATLSTMTGRTVAFRHMRATLFTSEPMFELDDLVIGSPPAITRAALLTTPRAVVRIRLAALMTGDPHVFDVGLDRPAAHLVRLGHGRNNYSFGTAGGSNAWRRLGRFQFDDGTLIYDDPERHAVLSGHISHTAGNAGLRALHLSGGGEINDGAFTIDAWGGSLANRDARSPYPFTARITDGAVQVRLTGVSGKPFDYRKLDVTLEASGPDLADLTYLFEAPAPDSAAFNLTAHLVRDQPALRMNDIVARIGRSDLTGSLTSDHPAGGRRTIQAVFRAQVLDLRDVRTALRRRPSHAQTRSIPMSAPPSADDGRLFPDAPFNLLALRRDDLDLQITAADAPGAPFRVAALNARLRLQRGRLTLDPVSFSADPGLVSGLMVLDGSRTPPQVALRVKVRGGRLAALAPRLAAVADAGLDADVDLRGAGRSLHAAAGSAEGRVALRLGQGRLQASKAAALGGDLVKALGLALGDKTRQTALTCAVADFQAKAGRLEVRNLVIVTAAGSTRGSGAIDLGGETIALALQGTPAHPRLLQVNAPVHIDGPLSRPGVRPDVLKGLGRLAASLRPGRPKAESDCRQAIDGGVDRERRNITLAPR